MNEISPSNETAPQSEDQQAITDYFASETYARARSRVSPLRSPAKTPWPDPSLSSAASFRVGLGGLGGILFLFGILSPVLTGMLHAVMGAGDSYVIFAMLDQTILYPTIVSFTFAIVTPMFWYGSVLVRFALASILILPGCLAFLGSSSWLDPPSGFWAIFTAVVFAMFIVISVVAVLVQMWSHWTLSHSQPIDAPLIPAGTRYIMELTGVAAVGCAVFFSIDTSELVETLLLFTSLGLLSSAAVLSMLIAFLRPSERNFFAAAVALLLAFGVSFVFAGTLAFQEFGWNELPDMMPEILIATTYGTVVFMALMWFCMWWLRSCGWACLSLKEAKRVRETEKPDLWRFWFGV